MSQHTITVGKRRLSDLVNRALKGETIVITRRGRAVVEIKPIGQCARPIAPDDIDWLAERLISRIGGAIVARTLVSTMRGEDDRSELT